MMRVDHQGVIVDCLVIINSLLSLSPHANSTRTYTCTYTCACQHKLAVKHMSCNPPLTRSPLNTHTHTNAHANPTPQHT